MGYANNSKFYPDATHPCIADSHAHILEYGFMKVLPLEGTQTVKGQ